MNTLSKLNYPDMDDFTIALDALDLVSRCRVMQQLQSVVSPFKEGYRLSYACMDSVSSPLNVIAGQINRCEIMPYNLACNLLGKPVSKLASYPVNLHYFDLPLGFTLKSDVVRYTDDLKTKVEHTQCAHELAAYILLNEMSYIEIGEERKSCVNKTVFKRHLNGVIVITDAGGSHERLTSINLKTMSDYIALFNAIMMALSEV